MAEEKKKKKGKKKKARSLSDITVARYSDSYGKPERAKKATRTKRGKRKKLLSEKNPYFFTDDTIGPGKRTRGYVMEDARYTLPLGSGIGREVYKTKDGKGKAKRVNFSTGGKVRGAGIARKGVRPARML